MAIAVISATGLARLYTISIPDPNLCCQWQRPTNHFCWILTSASSVWSSYLSDVLSLIMVRWLWWWYWFKPENWVLWGTVVHCSSAINPVHCEGTPQINKSKNNIYKNKKTNSVEKIVTTCNNHNHDDNERIFDHFGILHSIPSLCIGERPRQHLSYVKSPVQHSSCTAGTRCRAALLLRCSFW